MVSIMPLMSVSGVREAKLETCDMELQIAAELLQRLDFAARVREMPAQDGEHAKLGLSAARIIEIQIDDGCDLFETETEHLQLLDLAQPRHSRGGVGAMRARLARIER